MAELIVSLQTLPAEPAVSGVGFYLAEGSERESWLPLLYAKAKKHDIANISYHLWDYRTTLLRFMGTANLTKV